MEREAPKGPEPGPGPRPRQGPQPVNGTEREPAGSTPQPEPAAGANRVQGTAPPAASGLIAPGQLPVTFSRPGTKATVLLTAGIVPLLLLVAALNPSGFWWARLIAGVVVLAAGAVMARIVLVAIVAKPDRLVTRNLRNTHRIPWSRVAEIFETPPPPPSVYRDNPLYRREIDLLVGLTNGSVISATLYSHRLFPENHSGRREVTDQLNDLRRQLNPRSGGESSVADSGPDLLS
jgi:hypothetical protein